MPARENENVCRGGGTGEAAASPNFRALLKGNINDFDMKKGKFSGEPFGLWRLWITLYIYHY